MNFFEKLNLGIMIFNKNLDKSLRYTGFTLAEVLIVLGIIGIIAAITIPILQHNIQDQVTKSAVREAYSLLIQAQKQAGVDNNGTIANICTSDLDDNCLKNIFKPYLNYVKDCDLNTSLQDGCWVSHLFSDKDIGTAGMYNFNYPAILLKNGMMVIFRGHTADCTPIYNVNGTCGWMGIDINGAKKPNVWGKDAFYFSIQKSSIKPGGSEGDTGNFETCTGAETGGLAGWGCTYKYLYE